MSKTVTTHSAGSRKFEEAAQLALDEARSLGADQAEVAVSQDVGLSATARMGDVESLEYTNDRGVAITVYCGKRKGSASTSDLTESAIRETVAKACAFAGALGGEEGLERSFGGVRVHAQTCVLNGEAEVVWCVRLVARGKGGREG